MKLISTHCIGVLEKESMTTDLVILTEFSGNKP
jgi:hypothetical protein